MQLSWPAIPLCLLGMYVHSPSHLENSLSVVNLVSSQGECVFCVSVASRNVLLPGSADGGLCGLQTESSTDLSVR